MYLDMYLYRYLYVSVYVPVSISVSKPVLYSAWEPVSIQISTGGNHASMGLQQIQKSLHPVPLSYNAGLRKSAHQVNGGNADLFRARII